MTSTSSAIAIKEKRSAALSSVVAAVLLTTLKLVVGLLTGTLMVVVDGREVLIARSDMDTTTATITRNPNLVLIARQFVWMELFAQRIYGRLGADLLARLDPSDRRVFESLIASKATVP